MYKTAEEARVALREMIISREVQNQNITGVGTESSREEGAPEKLVVWYDGDLEKAQSFLSGKLGDYPTVWVRSRSRGLSSARALETSPFARLAGRNTSATFTMQDLIVPLDGDKGRPGCFVRLSDGSTPVLTANHLFVWRVIADPKPVYVFDSFMRKQRIGLSSVFGRLGYSIDTASMADCALFIADTEPPFRDSELSGGFVKDADIGDALQKRVHTLMPSSDAGYGVIVAANHTITVEISQGMPDGSIVTLGCVFDRQIAIINESNLAFGIDGHSGSLAIMKEDGAKVRVGDALGIYMGGDAGNTYHLVSSFEACMHGLGQAGMMVF